MPPNLPPNFLLTFACVLKRRGILCINNAQATAFALTFQSSDGVHMIHLVVMHAGEREIAAFPVTVEPWERNFWMVGEDVQS